MYALYGYLTTTHSGLRWLLLLIIGGSIAYAIHGLRNNRATDDIDDRLSMFSSVFSHIMLVIGLALYYVSPKLKKAFSDEGDIMGDKIDRFWAIEHMVGMLIAIVFISIGRALYKKREDDRGKMKAVVVYFSLALFFMLISIPWPFREHLGKGWF